MRENDSSTPAGEINRLGPTIKDTWRGIHPSADVLCAVCGERFDKHRQHPYCNCPKTKTPLRDGEWPYRVEAFVPAFARDVTDEVAALRAERDDALTAYRALADAIRAVAPSAFCLWVAGVVREAGVTDRLDALDAASEHVADRVRPHLDRFKCESGTYCIVLRDRAAQQETPTHAHHWEHRGGDLWACECGARGHRNIVNGEDRGIKECSHDHVA